jgi:hypothetical protein
VGLWEGLRQEARAKQLLGTIQRLACLGITGAMRTTPTNVMEALVGLPPLDLVVQGEARASAHHLWSPGSWSYLHPNSGHSRILVQLQQSDPIFSMRVDVMRPTYNFEPRSRVVALTREEWDSPQRQGACLVHRWVSDAGRDQGRGVWAARGKEALSPLGDTP